MNSMRSVSDWKPWMFLLSSGFITPRNSEFTCSSISSTLCTPSLMMLCSSSSRSLLCPLMSISA